MTEDQRERRRAASEKWRRNNPEKQRAARQNWYKNNKERQRAAAKSWAEANADRLRDGYLLRKYGISLAEYDARLDAQGGVCAICGGPPQGGRGPHFDVDHDHETGRVRGLLCHLCNAGFGYFREDPTILAAAIVYAQNALSVSAENGATPKMTPVAERAGDSPQSSF